MIKIIICASIKIKMVIGFYRNSLIQFEPVKQCLFQQESFLFPKKNCEFQIGGWFVALAWKMIAPFTAMLNHISLDRLFPFSSQPTSIILKTSSDLLYCFHPTTIIESCIHINSQKLSIVDKLLCISLFLRSYHDWCADQTLFCAIEEMVAILKPFSAFLMKTNSRSNWATQNKKK